MAKKQTRKPLTEEQIEKWRKVLEEVVLKPLADLAATREFLASHPDVEAKIT